ncbi:hypothetical protein NP233_g6600 [Leucocoprinus birnbaumii]|uniref:MFS general substrate transporter n=1 Tax=Leucocoprinus birnbaumii TaxID=56174 RepID=A0AAD5YPV8_9AGAR|nr:hypothetical protein NP233_g6600 [Leucocoprinus birnbaumii]
MTNEIINPEETPGSSRTNPIISLPDEPPQATRRTSSESTTPTVVDIEHAPVRNDPRQWSSFRKHFSLFLISSAAMIAGLAGSIQNPAVKDMERELPATSQQFSLSLSLFILVQGLVPLLWTAISEVKGRKLVYQVSLAFFAAASVVVALSPNIELVIAFRAIQAAGSSAVIAIGAATLADIFEPAERGTKACADGDLLHCSPARSCTRSHCRWWVDYGTGLEIYFLVPRHSLWVKLASDIIKRRLGDKSPDHSIALSPHKSTPGTIDDLEKAASGAGQDSLASDPPEIKLSLRDVNPLKPIGLVLRRINNLAILFASGARTLSSDYHYDAFIIGVILISYGIGCVFGSLLGGRWSDHKLAQLKEANGGKSYPEMRLKAALPGMVFLPPSIIGFGWMYASTLAYIVDANNGRSATAVATNSAFRGFFAFIATEIAVPMQDNIGDGWLYTVWGLIMAISCALTLSVMWKGEAWRKQAEEREARAITRLD